VMHRPLGETLAQLDCHLFPDAAPLSNGAG